MDEFTDNDYQRAHFFAKYIAVRGWDFESLTEEQLDEAASFILTARTAEARFWRGHEEAKTDALWDEIENGLSEEDTTILSWGSDDLFALSGLEKRAAKNKQSEQQRNYWCNRANKFQGKSSKVDGSWAKSFKKSGGISRSVAMILKALDKRVGGIEKYKRKKLPPEQSDKFTRLKLKTRNISKKPRMWMEGPSAGLDDSRDWVNEKLSHLVVYGTSQCKSLQSPPISREST